MLQHDYLLEIIAEFVQLVMNALRHALEKGDQASVQEVEDAVCELLDLDPILALRLSPDSLVTMMLLSGMGDSLAEYVTYSLRKVADAYDRMGEADLALERRAQSRAVAESFGCAEDAVPYEFEAFEGELG